MLAWICVKISIFTLYLPRILRFIDETHKWRRRQIETKKNKVIMRNILVSDCLVRKQTANFLTKRTKRKSCFNRIKLDFIVFESRTILLDMQESCNRCPGQILCSSQSEGTIQLFCIEFEWPINIDGAKLRSYNISLNLCVDHFPYFSKMRCAENGRSSTCDKEK